MDVTGCGICLFACLTVCVSVYLSISLSIYMFRSLINSFIHSFIHSNATHGTRYKLLKNNPSTASHQKRENSTKKEKEEKVPEWTAIQNFRSSKASSTFIST